MKELNINEIHAETLKILIKIHAICEELNINYFLAYGSLIGAVRHKGFIPWDDDLDIVMLRKDYEIFCNYCRTKSDLLYPYKLLNREVCPEYPFNIGRFNDMRYKAIYDNIKEYDSGMFIDIYPLDPISDISEKNIKKLDMKRNYLMQMILWSIDTHYVSSKHNKWYRSFIKFFARLYAKIRGKDYFLNKMEKLGKLYNYEDSNYVSEMTWDVKTVVLKKDWFLGFSVVEFEGYMFKAPLNVDSFLKAYYGDYMKLPPINQRVPNHGYKLYRRKEYEENNI